MDKIAEQRVIADSILQHFRILAALKLAADAGRDAEELLALIKRLDSEVLVSDFRELTSIIMQREMKTTAQMVMTNKAAKARRKIGANKKAKILAAITVGEDPTSIATERHVRRAKKKKS
ncbi:MAG TPA: hypothetical protein VK629_10775 [Steroidobacteraceae bacterium]|nr:hypothetical protein [Steroidobacteraceae bacterium]